MINSCGIVNYSTNACWLVVDAQLNKYLRNLYYMWAYGVAKLGRPSNGDHITVVNDFEQSEIIHKDLWRKHLGREIVFSFQLAPASNGNAIWYTVNCEEGLQLRTELGLGRPKVVLHLCIGYLSEGKRELQ